MSQDSTRILRVTDGLRTLWQANPHLTFGKMIETVEDLAWAKLEQTTQRGYSARWANLPDVFLEQAVAQLLAKGGKL